MDTPTASVKKIALNYGIYLVLASILLHVISVITNNHIDQPWYLSLIGFIISVILFVYALKAFKKENGGFMSLSEALKVGMGAAVISGIIYAIYFYIFAALVEPTYISDLMEFRMDQMIEGKPNITQEEIDQTSKIQAMFTKPWIMSAMVIIISLFWGFIISLIAGLIMKQNRPEH